MVRGGSDGSGDGRDNRDGYEGFGPAIDPQTARERLSEAMAMQRGYRWNFKIIDTGPNWTRFRTGYGMFTRDWIVYIFIDGTEEVIRWR